MDRPALISLHMNEQSFTLLKIRIRNIPTRSPAHHFLARCTVLEKGCRDPFHKRFYGFALHLDLFVSLYHDVFPSTQLIDNSKRICGTDVVERRQNVGHWESMCGQLLLANRLCRRDIRGTSIICIGRHFPPSCARCICISRSLTRTWWRICTT